MIFSKVKPVVLVFVLLAAGAAVLTGTVLTVVETKPEVAKPVAEMYFKPGNITGMIVDSSGRALADVDVTARKNRGEVVARTKTDNSGRYILRNLEVGKFTIYVGTLRSSSLRVTRDSRISSLTIVTPASGGGENLSDGTTSRSPFNSSRPSWQNIQLSNTYVTVGGPVGPVDPTDPEPWDENVSP